MEDVDSSDQEDALLVSLPKRTKDKRVQELSGITSSVHLNDPYLKKSSSLKKSTFGSSASPSSSSPTVLSLVDVVLPPVSRLPQNEPSSSKVSPSPATESYLKPQPGICELCMIHVALYKCPKCNLRTCSLLCCNRHKSMYNCSGIRPSSTFVPMKDFGDRELLADLAFLEDVERVIDSAYRDPILHHRRRRPQKGKPNSFKRPTKKKP